VRRFGPVHCYGVHQCSKEKVSCVSGNAYFLNFNLTAVGA
jgi:hypothetical protein